MAHYHGTVIIEWPEPHGKGPYGVITGYKVTITDALTGKPVRTVTDADVTIHAGASELVTASLTMFADVDAAAAARRRAGSRPGRQGLPHRRVPVPGRRDAGEPGVSDEIPPDPISALAEGAAAVHELFTAYVNAEFTRQEALQIVIAIITAPLRPGQS